MNVNKLDIPDDENGDVLRRMLEHGDDLSKPRNIEFCFAFTDRKQALDFAAIVDEHDLEVSISSYDERNGWQVIVTRHMIPTHREITQLEISLAKRAESAGGQADGWGCLQVD